MKQSRTEREKGVGAILFLAIIYGVLPLFPRYLSTSFTIFQQIYLRMFIGFLLLVILFHKYINFKKVFNLPTKETGWIFLRAFTYFFLGVGLYTYAVLNTKISNVAFITAIPTTAILGFLLLHERITVSKLTLVLLSVVGVLIISVKELTGSFSIGIGEIAALLSALCTSLGLITRKWNSKYFNDQETAALMLLFTSIQFIVASLIIGEGIPLDGWSVGILLVLLLAGLLNSGVSFFMNYGFARIDAVLANNIISLEVLFATILAFILFRELPTGKELFGGLLIIISAFFLHRYEKNKNLVDR